MPSYSKLSQTFHKKVFHEGTFNIPIRYVFLHEEILSSGGEGVVM
jgi:hypothetical protein